MTIRLNKWLLGAVAVLILILIGAGFAGFQLSRRSALPATAAQPAVQTQSQVADVAQASQPTPARMTSNGFPLLTPAEVNTLRLQPDVLVIDVRGDFVWAREHVPGAISFPEDQAEQRWNELPQDKLIVAY